MKRFNFLLVTLLASLTFSFMGTSCGTTTGSGTSSGTTTAGTSIESIAIEGPLEVGLREHIQLKATFNGAEQKVRWESSDTKIATVSSTGMVKGMSIGEVTIKATLISNENIHQSITIKVQESMQIGLVFKRFTDENSTYVVEGKGNVETTLGTKEMKFKESHYKDSYLFTNMSSLMLPTYGIGEGKEGTYVYNFTEDDITSAIYMRAYNKNYENVIVDITDLSSVDINFSSINKSEDNTYEVNNTSFMGLMFYIWSQNINVNQSEYQSLQSDLSSKMTSTTIHILTPYSFTCDLNFSEKVEGASLTFTKDDQAKNNEKLQSYLASHSITYPEIEADFLKAKNLAKTHNYYRDLGTYTGEGGAKMPIGKVYFTENAMYYDFNEEYIDEVEQQDKLFDKGYVNISGKEGYTDGVYEFTYKRNAEGTQVFELGNCVTDKDYQGNSYLHYYDFMENISLVMEYLKGKEYTFTPTTTSDYPTTYSQFYSNAETAQNVAYSLFQDEVNAFDATTNGFIFASYIDEENPENSVMNYGVIMTVLGQTTYLYSSYQYSGFGSVTIPVVDDFLKTL